MGALSGVPIYIYIFFFGCYYLSIFLFYLHFLKLFSVQFYGQTSIVLGYEPFNVQLMSFPHIYFRHFVLL